MKPCLVALLALFPAAFRRQFGADMAHELRRSYDTARARGRGPAAWFAMRAAANVIGSAAAERRRPTWFEGAVQPGFLQETSPMRRFIDGWRQDLKHAGRSLTHAPGFTAVTVGTLALAIGLTIAMFAVINAVLLHPLPYPNAGRIVYVTGDAPGSDITGEFGVADEFFVHYSERAKTIDHFATFAQFTSTMRANDHVERIRMSTMDLPGFAALGMSPQLGRLPTEADRDEVALLSDTLWTTWFGRNPDVIGQRFAIGGATRTVIGVMPANFRFPTDTTLVWFPNVVDPARIRPGQFGTGAIARLAPNATVEQAARELTSLAHELPGRFGGSAQYARLIDRYRALVRPLSEQMVGTPLRSSLWVLFGGAAIVLLIACANVANLFMVRSEGRLREMAVRQAVGAAAHQLVRVQLSEALLIAAASGVAATVLAFFGVPALVHAMPTFVPRLDDARVGPAAIAFAIAASLIVALLCGLVPALRAARPQMAWLREGARGSTRRSHWGRSALVVAQTSLALVLLIASGLLLRSYAKLSSVDAGFDARDVFTFQIAPEQPQLNTGPAFAQFALDFMTRMRALPGVQLVGLVENVPLDEGTASSRFMPDTASTPDAGARLSYTFSAGDHFKALGMTLLAGRAFTDDDAVGMRGNVVISKSAAAALWPGENPIGRRLQRDGTTTWETVVGVVNDVKQLDLRDTPSATVYFPLSGHTPTQWRLSSPGYVVKTARADSIAGDIRAIVKQIAPEAPMYRTYTMAQLESRVTSGLTFTMLTLGLVAAMALVLGALGLYGVLSYVVAERTREIGVRIALGAPPAGVRWMVVGQGMRVVVVGVAIGVGLALALAGGLRTLLFGVEALDPMTFVVMPVSMLIIGLAASYIPARRASHVDPIRSLR